MATETSWEDPLSVIDELIQLTSKLATERNLERLLGAILSTATRLTRAEAGRMRVNQAMRPVAVGSPEAMELLIGPNGGVAPHVHPDHPLSLALERMGSSGRNALPVVSRADARQLLGVVRLDDVLRAFGVNRPADARESTGLS